MAEEETIKIKVDAKDAIKETEKLGDAIKDAGDEAKASGAKFGEGLKKIKEGASSALDTLSDVVGAVKEFSAAAAAHEKHAAAVERLGEAYGAVTEATRGVVSAEEAMRVQGLASQAGFTLTAQQLATVTAAAREYSHATGNELSQTLEQLSEGLTELSNDALQKYGISLDTSKSRSDQLAGAIAQLAEKQGAAAPSALTLAEKNELLGRQIEEAKNAFAGAIMQSDGFKSALDTLISAAPKIIGVFVEIGNTVASVANAIAGFSGEVERAGGGTPRGVGHLVQGVRDQIETAGNAPLQGTGFGGARPNSLGNFQFDSSLSSFGQARRQRGGGGGGGGGASLTQLRKEFADAYKEAAKAGVQLRELEKTEAESFQEYGRRLADTISLTGHAFAQFERRRGESSQAALKRITEELKAAKDLQDELKELMQSAASSRRGTQAAGTYDAQISGDLSRLAANDTGDTAAFEADFFGDPTSLNKRRARQSELALQKQADEQRDVMGRLGSATSDFINSQKTGAEGLAEVWGSTMSTMTSSFKSHLAAVITGRETIGEALKGILQETLLNLATESAVKSIFELAQGVAAAASYRYAEATQHFVAAGTYAAVATVAGLGTYGLSQLGASAGAAGQSQTQQRSNPASTRSFGGDSENGGGATYVINVNGALLNEGVEDGVVRALDSAERRGVVPRNTRRLQQLSRAV